MVTRLLYCCSVVSLQHHIQMNHGGRDSDRSGDSRDHSGNTQIHIPQKDGHKRQPYQHYHDMPSHHQYPMHHGHPHHYKESNLNGVSRSSGGSHGAKASRLPTGATSRKQSYKGIVQQNRRDADMQYVDPPQEFLFNATKDSK